MKAVHIFLISLQGLSCLCSTSSLRTLFATAAYLDDELHLSTPVHTAWQPGMELSKKVPVPAQNILHRLLLNSRWLGDFDDLNKILAETELMLPDFAISTGGVDFSVSNLVCSNIYIQNLIVRHRRIGTRKLELDLVIQDLTIDCQLDWAFKWGFVRGDGPGQIYTKGSDALIQVTFESDNFNIKPPKNAYLSDCNSNIVIDDIDTQGGLFGWIFNAIEGALRGTIKEEADDGLCEEADAIGEALINLMLTLDDFIDPYEGTLPPELSDPLHPESQLKLNAPDESFFDFNNSQIFTTIIDLINDQLGAPVNDSNIFNEMEHDLGINEIIRSIILNEDGELIVNGTMLPNNGTLHDGEDILSRSTLTTETIRIKGLDTITKFDPLQTIGQHTLSNHFGWHFLDVEIDMKVIIRPTDADGAVIDSDEIVTEYISIDFGIDDLEVDFAMLLAVDEDAIQAIPLGAILTNSDQIGSCLGNAVKNVSVSLLSASAGNLDPPKVAGFISEGIDRVISSLVVAMFEMYEGAILDLMPNIFQITFRNMLNDVISSTFNFTNATHHCGTEENETSKYLNFPDLLLPKENATAVGGLGTEPYGPIGQTLYQVLNVAGSQSSGDELSFVNDLVINPLTRKQSGVNGTFRFPSPLADLDLFLELGDLAFSLQLGIFDMVIENLNTLRSPIVLLEPQAPQLLNNTAGIGISSKPFLLKTNLMFAIDVGGTGRIQNELQMSMEFDDLSIDAVVFIAFLESALMQFPMSDIGNVHCWLAKIPSPVLDAFGRAINDTSFLYFEHMDISTSESRLNIECVSCSSPMFEFMTEALKLRSAVDDLTDAVNDVLDWVVDILSGDFSQIQINRILVNSQKMCPHSTDFRDTFEPPTYQVASFSSELEMKDAFLMQFFVTVAALIFSVAAIMTIVRWISKRRFAEWMENLSAEDKYMVSERCKKEQFHQSQIDAGTTSMFGSSSIPFPVRILVPVIIIGNVLLFLSGHMSLGAAVNVDLEIAGEPLPLGSVFEFTLASSILDMWEAGSKALAIFIALFSGIWPYTKQIITLIMWFTPTRFCSSARRGSVLSWLDALGKWSFVDIFVLVVTLAAFRISIKSPDDFAFLLPGFYTVELIVIPSWGLYANMIAQMLSQVSSHFIMYYHRKIISDFERSNADERIIEDFAGKRVLRKHSFDRDGTKKGIELVVKPGVNIGMLVLFVVVFSLLIVGCSMNIFNIENNGIVGLLVEAGQDLEPASTSYSVFKIVRLMFEQAMYTGVASDYVGLGSIAIVFMFTVLIAPIAQGLFLLQRWFMPLDRAGRKRNYVIIECLQAWQYSEVFILSIIATSWQLAPVSEYFLNDTCDGLGDFFSALTAYGVVDGVNAQCFRADPSVMFGTWMLFLAALGLVTLSHFVSKAAEHERQDEISLYYSSDLVERMDKQYDINQGQNNFSTVVPPVRFTDYYRWLLRHDSHSGESFGISVTNVFPAPCPPGDLKLERSFESTSTIS